MPDRDKVFDAFRNCITEPKCKDCPWEQCEQFNQKKVSIPVTLALDVLNLLKEQEAKTGHWTISEYEYLDCSCCGNSYYTGCDSIEEAKMRLKNGFYFKYCPYCGAKMEMS